MSENESHSFERTDIFIGDLRGSTSESNVESKCRNICCLCTLFIKTIGRLFFIKKMSSSNRNNVIWIWIILLSLFGGLYVRCYVFQRRSIILLPSDMAIIDTIIPIFCASVSICYKGNKIEAYVSKKKPEFNKTKVAYNYTDSFILTKKYEKIWPINLLPNSSLSMKLCSEGLSQIDVITSKENFETWESDKECTRCLKDLTINSTCIELNLSHPPANIYYFVFSNVKNSSIIRAYISLKRTLYKISGKNVATKKYSGCIKIPTELRSKEYILLHFLSKQWKLVTLTILFNSRNYTFIILFLILPFSLGLMFTVITEKVFKNDLDEELEEIDNTSTSSVIEDINSTRPPSYDSIFPEGNDNTLPSYEKCAEIGIQNSS